MLKQRVLTAIVLVLLFTVVTVGLSPFWFAVVMALLLLAASHEWTALIGLGTVAARWTYLGSLLLLLAGLFVMLGVSPAATSLDGLRVNSLLLLGLVFWGLALLLLRGYPGNATQWNDPSRIALMGLLVLLPTWTGLVQLKYMAPGGQLVLLLVGLVSVADIAAFFTGRRWGRSKLAPALSPNKSWAGVWGSLVVTTLCASVCVVIVDNFFVSLSLLRSLLLIVATVPLVIFSIAGDLFESMLKRNRGLKDSGKLLPGHGGILDRIDSLTAAMPVYVLVLALLVPGA